MRAAHPRRLRAVAATLGFALAAAATGAAAQTPHRILVRVRQVAGSSVYVEVGTGHGLLTGDTVGVAFDTLAAPSAALVVTATGPTRSVLTFAGAPFPVAGGNVLALYLPRAPTGLAPPVTPAPAAPAAHLPDQGPGDSQRRAVPGVAAERAAPSPRRAHGRVALDLTALRSTTIFGEPSALEVDRTYATPALRLDATFPGAVGGFDLRIGGRLAYRYAGQEVASPAGSARLYSASIERRFHALPLALSLGRFHSPAERYSGYWDGVYARYGGAGAGIAILAGFQPDRWNEAPGLDRPKGSVVLDASRRGAGWRWSADASLHRVQGGDSLADHTFAGLSQRLTLGPLRLSQDLQVDRDAAEGGWRASYLAVRGSLAASAGVDLRAGFTRRESWLAWLPDPTFAEPRDRLSAGLTLVAGRASVSGDVSRSDEGGGTASTGYTAALRLPGLLPSGADVDATASYWTGSRGHALAASPGLSFVRGTARLRAGYRIHRSDYLDRAITTHAGDLSADAPLTAALRATLRLRIQRGASLRSESVALTLYRVF